MSPSFSFSEKTVGFLIEDGVFNKLREREYFMSKGEKRRIAKAAGRARARRETQRKLEEYGF